MKITNAEIKRISNMAEPDRYKFLRQLNSQVLEIIVRKARELETESNIAKRPVEAEKYSALIGTAAILFPEKKYPGAIVSIILLFIFFTSCTAPRPVHSGLTYEKVTSIEKIKDGTVVMIEGSRGKYIVPSDTIKVGDIIEVSWIQPIRH